MLSTFGNATDVPRLPKLNLRWRACDQTQAPGLATPQIACAQTSSQPSHAPPGVFVATPLTLFLPEPPRQGPDHRGVFHLLSGALSLTEKCWIMMLVLTTMIVLMLRKRRQHSQHMPSPKYQAKGVGLDMRLQSRRCFSAPPG